MSLTPNAHHRKVWIRTGFNQNLHVPGPLAHRPRLYRTAVIFLPDFERLSKNGVVCQMDWKEWQDVFWNLVNRLTVAFGKNIQLKLFSGEKMSVSPKEYLEKQRGNECPPPTRIVYAEGQNARCIMEAEFWVFAGGSYPYSDSYTFSFYSDQRETDSIVMQCCKTCLEEAGVEMLGETQEFTNPVPTAFLSRQMFYFRNGEMAKRAKDFCDSNGFLGITLGISSYLFFILFIGQIFGCLPARFAISESAFIWVFLILAGLKITYGICYKKALKSMWGPIVAGLILAIYVNCR